MKKTCVFQCIKGNTIRKYPAFLGLFVWIEKGQKENPLKCNACAVNQKIVTAWFSGNALISTEPLVRIKVE